jgi:hypothetical protein
MRPWCPSMTSIPHTRKKFYAKCQTERRIDMTHPFISASKELIQPVLSSKMEEFHMLGYEEVTENDLLSYLEMKKWKKEKELSLHQVVNDILSVKITQVMSYVTIESYKSDMFSSVNNGEDWKELLK